jgi:hypothetical protein
MQKERMGGGWANTYSAVCRTLDSGQRLFHILQRGDQANHAAVSGVHLQHAWRVPCARSRGRPRVPWVEKTVFDVPPQQLHHFSKRNSGSTSKKITPPSVAARVERRPNRAMPAHIHLGSSSSEAKARHPHLTLTLTPVPPSSHKSASEHGGD